MCDLGFAVFGSGCYVQLNDEVRHVCFIMIVL